MTPDEFCAFARREVADLRRRVDAEIARVARQRFRAGLWFLAGFIWPLAVLLLALAILRHP